ncbi:hypothetical protein GCM10022225_67580 [Plantactinospora mayteni]|uniref:Antigen 84 n=1 Tax=Plantactinospora mayteni TaxID=566021 RepID=A0ABQ4EV55_9ACTN|nr:DivIVA domain-containing protein [Plantactinospora mayteni]GIG98557.1 hypothetical protein Pma05_51300 [Plantactinospora mayteni]
MGEHSHRPARGRSGIPYPATGRPTLMPWQVRERRFRTVGFGRRGLDPTEVREFLERVAGDLAAVQQALAHSQQETARLGDTLRRWQARHTGTGNRWEGR